MTTPDPNDIQIEDAEVEAAEAGDQPAEGATSRQTNSASAKAQAEGER